MTPLDFRNGQAVDLGAIEHMEIGPFHEAILAGVNNGARISSLFAAKMPSGESAIYALLAFDAQHSLRVLSAKVSGSFPALTASCPQAHLFEREILEQFGIVPQGHPWMKPVRHHHFDSGTAASGQNSSYPFFRMTGDQVHEVAVGPVHAGGIEPGHFRFQCHGEVVYHLEIHLGYQHRGVEEALVGGPNKRTLGQIEVVAGDTTIGHATAYCSILESLSGTAPPPRALALRAIALELERLANHVGDIGALSNDVGFLPTASYCGRLRAEFLNMTTAVCGNRMGHGMVRPGGVAFDVDAGMGDDLLKRLDTASRDLALLVEQFFSTQSVMARLECVGKVSTQTCNDLGFVGLAARASGCPRDLRVDHPLGWYKEASIPVVSFSSGDVLARAMVRSLEAERSLVFVREQLGRLPSGEVTSSCGQLAPNKFAVALVEGWRGEIAHVAITDGWGNFARYKIVDPSFHNWTALAMALRGQQISDFPLCNKSFNLSYCGFDL